MEKQFTQIGKFTLFIFLPLFICFTAIAILAYDSDEFRLYMFGVLSVIFFLCLLTFYKLTIRVSRRELSFKMGVGLFSRKYPLKEIKSVRPVTNNMMYGIGIRFIPDGWLYNVSGTKAIELSFKNKKGIVRIGTDKPHEVTKAIEEARGRVK